MYSELLKAFQSNKNCSFYTDDECDKFIYGKIIALNEDEVATRLLNKYITKKHTLAFGIDIIAIVMCLIICANCVLCLINGNDLFSYIAINEYNKLNA